MTNHVVVGVKGAENGVVAPNQTWPTRLQLQQLMEEHTIDMLDELGSGEGAAGLCKRLGTDPTQGLPERIADYDLRQETFGENKFEERKLTPYWRYVLEQLKEKIILLLICMASLELLIKGILGNALSFSTELEQQEAYGESGMLYMTVAIIVNIAAFLDWKRERMYEALTKRLQSSNMRFVVRGGKQITVTDAEIVVGDIMSFNAHMASIISCDGIFLGGQDVKTDESALTGEPEPISKTPAKPFMISGTTVSAGSGTMLVIAVGEYSIAGKIRKDVYGGGDQESPLYKKLDTMASTIAKFGCFFAGIAWIALIAWEFGSPKEKTSKNPDGRQRPKKLIDIFLQTLGILACAIPEGLPLALIISLALTSSKMSSESNLVKTLNSCETMGSATTICTDKTGTLTTNRMTVRGAYIDGILLDIKDHEPVSSSIKGNPSLSTEATKLLSQLICVCTMDESGIRYEEGSKIPIFQGNPTECALLKLAEEIGYDYKTIREETAGRSKETLERGSCKVFSSARKMMSWTVPLPTGGYRVFAKGASEIILSRCTRISTQGRVAALTEQTMAELTNGVISNFANMAMRTIGLAYKDITNLDPDNLDSSIKNSDGSPAFNCETDLILLAITGIEDPLRAEVAPAIARCYKAGIDVRMVTGDNLATAIAIAKGAGILNLSLHCDKSGKVLPKRAMEGKDFRKMVHDYNEQGEASFNQYKFDEVWPYLRVLARSSPDDKLTLAKGLNGSHLFKDKKKCAELKQNDQITIFPDRQVVAMTGDGTNDAPALKFADVGFAMGIAGTQIAKDAANIILLDDNFASIVTAAKWGRNVYDSIQKFLQFQLTVNVAILILNAICAIADVPCPLTVLHLLWLNLMMDSAASIQLASERPTDTLLERPPVNRNDSIISKRMLMNILGMAAYELAIVIGLLWKYDWIPELVIDTAIDPVTGLPKDPLTGPRSRHYTMLFNVFVLFQIFNEYNSRFLRDEWQIWRGLADNKLFVVISASTLLLQVLMVQVAAPILEKPLKIHPRGLTPTQWGICFGFAAGTLVAQQVFNLMRRLGTFLFEHFEQRSQRVAPIEESEDPVFTISNKALAT